MTRASAVLVFQDVSNPLFCKPLYQWCYFNFRHFSGYCHLFHQVLLEEEVLPQLLLGIRDSNDSLVADSLRALADLVPILGASRVIGKNRRKVFSNGYPGKVSSSFFSSRLRLQWAKVQNTILITIGLLFLLGLTSKTDNLTSDRPKFRIEWRKIGKSSSGNPTKERRTTFTTGVKTERKRYYNFTIYQSETNLRFLRSFRDSECSV